MAIQKRYQYISKDGVVWTEWFNYCEDNSLLRTFQKEEKYQLKNHLLNEFRVV